jgi:hypothetical protein
MRRNRGTPVQGTVVGKEEVDGSVKIVKFCGYDHVVHDDNEEEEEKEEKGKDEWD